jgi:hypothetical protein
VKKAKQSGPTIGDLMRNPATHADGVKHARNIAGLLGLPFEADDALLERLRAHRYFGVLVETLRFDLEDLREGFGEDYPGEAAGRREAYELLIELLVGEKP